MNNMILAKRLKELREKNGYLQKFVADQLGIKSNTLSGYENGTRSPDPDMLVALSELYNVTTDYLLGRTDKRELNNKVTVAGQEITLSREEVKLFEELKKHPAMFHDLASDPEKKIKELIKLYKMKKMFLEEEDEKYGDGFGELED